MKTILVTGATGAQGGSVAKHLLASGEFRVRALTRNVNSPKAIALKKAGAEVYQGDFADKHSLDAAMKDVYGVFGVTNFWEHYDEEYELGKNLIEAVVANKVEHFIFSSLPPAKKISKGQLKIPHFDIKADLESYAKSIIPGTTVINVAAYFENFYTHYHPQRTFDGQYFFGFPQGNTRYAGVSVEDVGGVILALFHSPLLYRDLTVGIVGDDLYPSEYASVMSSVLQKNIQYTHISTEEYASYDFPGAREIATMFEFNRKYIRERQADLEFSKILFPGIRSFRDWVKENVKHFNLPVANSWLLTAS